MKNLFGLLLISAVAASCVNLNGQLNVQSSMAIKKRSGFLNLSTKTVTLEPGSYSSELKLKSDKNFVLRIRSNKDDSEIIVPIKSKNNLNIPDTGAINVTSNEISQPFDLNGSIKTNYSDSPTIRSTESCSIYRVERRCEKICRTTRIPTPPRGHDRDDRNGKGDDRREGGREETRCDIVCRDISISFPGIRYVDYHTRFTSRDLNVTLNDVKSSAQLATLKVNGTSSETINDYISECR